MSWNVPVLWGGAGNGPASFLPPGTSVSLHTTFFSASAGCTQGPPVSDQPGEAAIASSSPRASALCAAKRKASFHSGVMNTRR